MPELSWWTVGLASILSFLVYATWRIDSQKPDGEKGYGPALMWLIISLVYIAVWGWFQ